MMIKEAVNSPRVWGEMNHSKHHYRLFWSFGHWSTSTVLEWPGDLLTSSALKYSQSDKWSLLRSCVALAAPRSGPDTGSFRLHWTRRSCRRATARRATDERTSERRAGTDPPPTSHGLHLRTFLCCCCFPPHAATFWLHWTQHILDILNKERM